jgi:hypothetical protein
MLGAAKSYIWSIAIIFCKTCSEKTKKNTKKKPFAKSELTTSTNLTLPTKLQKPSEIKCLPLQTQKANKSVFLHFIELVFFRSEKKK